jgi:drug/metabolite transporter (DMT)-like permease
MQWLGDAMAIGCALAWAFAVLAFRRVDGVEPAALNLFKNTFSAALLLPTMAVLGLELDVSRSAEDWARLIVSGLLGLAVADTLFLAGLRRVDASVAALADCVYAPSVLVLSILFLGEGVGAGLFVGMPLVVVGLVIVAWRRREDRKPVDRRGVLLCVAGVMTTAVAVIVAKPVLERSELIEATLVRLTAGAVGIGLFEAVSGRGREALTLFRPHPAHRFALLGAFLGTYVAMVLWLGGMKYGAASRAALLNQSATVFVLVLSRLFGEAIPARRWLGAAIAVAGVLVVLGEGSPREVPPARAQGVGAAASDSPR